MMDIEKWQKIYTVKEIWICYNVWFIWKSCLYDSNHAHI